MSRAKWAIRYFMCAICGDTKLDEVKALIDACVRESLTSGCNPHQDDGLERNKDTKNEKHVQGNFPQSIANVHCVLRSADGRFDDTCDADSNCRSQHDTENRAPSCDQRNRTIREGRVGKQTTVKWLAMFANARDKVPTDQ